MFTKSARFYDVLYSAKDYAGESARLHALIQQHKRSGGAALLDVACGAGGHLSYLRPQYALEGLDLDDTMLAVACERFPDIPFHCADMADFALGRKFDVVTCLFGSIGYVRTVERLRQMLANCARHLQPGGVLILEPWLTPDQFHPGAVYAVFVDQPDLKIARISVS